MLPFSKTFCAVLHVRDIPIFQREILSPHESPEPSSASVLHGWDHERNAPPPNMSLLGQGVKGSGKLMDIGLEDSSRKLKKLKMDRHADMPMLGKFLSVGQHDEVDLQQPNLSAGTTGTTRSTRWRYISSALFRVAALLSWML